MSIPNLREVYGKQYRVSRDPCADSWHDTWLHTIPTRTGEVYVHGEEYAGVEVGTRYYSVHARLREAGYPLHQDGDDVRVYLVPWSELAVVLPCLRPYRRRQVELSQEQRQILIDRMEGINASRRAQVQELPDEQEGP